MPFFDNDALNSKKKSKIDNSDLMLGFSFPNKNKTKKPLNKAFGKLGEPFEDY